MDDLDLFNIALSLFDREIAEADLESKTPSKEVRLCYKYLPFARLRAMREFDWSFLIQELELDLDNDVGGFLGFLHGYKLPENLLKVVPGDNPNTYQVTAGRYFTNVDNPKVYGVMKELPEEHVPDDFYELIAYALAYQIAPLLAPGGKMDQVTLQKYTWALNGLISAECHNASREA